MDRNRIRELVAMLRSSSAAELEVREGNKRIRLRKRGGGAREVQVSADTTPGDGDGLRQPEVDDPLADATVVAAQLVGLFHRGAAPGARALVEVGDAVAQGQQVATIEALRNLTEVTSPIDGQVVQVIAQDGEPVQYGDQLLAIRPKG